MSYDVIDRLPTLDEFIAVTSAVGWQLAYDADALPVSLARSLHAVVAVHGGEVVGVGRVLGDGAIYFYLHDIAVLPEHQGRGVGRAIVTALERWIATQAGPRSFVGLFAAGDTKRLYKSFGYRKDPEMTGMYRVGPYRA
ncbi:GNAT family N-acetyltransferase [Catellatospora vulcania]|uniref:GNAT family N-acetyltransferase n=1 Tax=Catellatospora vulcania TaxID=1460450 RepID=UPI0018AF6D14|nr:GNAT family N-acetyltransferase [Catellatospora vulcania]